MIKELFHRNKLTSTTGFIFLGCAFLLSIYAFFDTTVILGVNAMIKPIKFFLSTGIYLLTLSWLLYYVENKASVKKLSLLAVFVMSFENSVIAIQAFRGTRSHFNQLDLAGGVLYGLMGVFIVWLTTSTLILTIRFFQQKQFSINKSYARSIQLGLLLFVIFSFFGGYMSAVNSHNVGGEMGGAGLPILNWSTLFGDLRVAHFFGMHALQIIPLAGYFISKKISDTKRAIFYVHLVSAIWFLFVLFTAYQAIHAQPFIAR
jgi:hypothetical protein